MQLLKLLKSQGCGLVWRGCGGTGSLAVGNLLVCERPVDGFSRSPPDRALQADTMRKLVMAEDAADLLPRPRVCFVYLSGGQLRPTDWAMAARSARTSSCEEESRSTDDEERWLTKRSIEWHRANNWETLFGGEKAENTIIYRPRQRPHCLLRLNDRKRRSPLQKRGVKRCAARAAQKKT